MQVAVQQAISAMRARYYERLTLTELAASVFVSPFHFSRQFAKLTGVTPGRYLAAIRMFEAKRLLLTTSRTVSDIVCSVGYGSVGTFTTRFSRAVGMTPSQYRSPTVADLLVAAAPDFCRVPSIEALREAGLHCVPVPRPGGSSITGTIELPPEAAPANIIIGVFGESVPQGAPVGHKYLRNVGSSRLDIHDVPPGRWFVIAVAERFTARPADRPILLGTLPQPITVFPGRATRVHLRMRALAPTDPPLAISLASLRSSGGEPTGEHQSGVLGAVA